MRRPLGALLCLGSLAALSTPIATAHAAAAPQVACRVYVAKPYVTAAGKIQASAARLGCADTALVRIRIKRAVAGTDPIVKSASRKGTNGRVTVNLRCAPGVYYATATDYRGHTSTSKAVRLSSCTPTPTKPTPPATTAPPAQGSTVADEVVKLTNAERQKGGCAPLIHDPQLRSAAQGHSAAMATAQILDHTLNGRDMTDRIKASGFTPVSAWAENISQGRPTPAAVVAGWMNSADHKANIMNCAYTHIGVGSAPSAQNGTYWTQDFAKH
jgi:uncharacterized protein YkwD